MALRFIVAKTDKKLNGTKYVSYVYFLKWKQRNKNKAGKKAQWVKYLIGKPQNLSWNTGTHTVKGESWCLKTSIQTHAHMHK